MIEKLKSIPVMHLTKNQLELLRAEDRPRIEAILHRTHEGFQQLLEALDPQKYPKARTYIENLIRPITTLFRWWLHKGELILLNTNAIKSAFSQVYNQIKKIRRRWSDKGLLNWFKIVFYKIPKPQCWGFPFGFISRTRSLKLNCFPSKPHTSGQEVSRNF